MNYSSLCSSPGTKLGRTCRAHAQVCVQRGWSVFQGFFGADAQLRSAPLRSCRFSADSNSRWTPAAVGCGLSVEVLERACSDLANISPDRFTNKCSRDANT